MKIKQLYLLLVLPTILLSSSCEKVGDLFTFGFNLQNDFSLPPNLPINTPFNLPSIPMDYNSSETFEQNNTRADLVKEITLEYITLTIKEPAGQDFTFLKDVELSLDKDGLGPKLVAWKYDVADTVGQELNLEVTKDALDEYLKTDNVSFILKATTDKLTTKEVKISSDIRVRVKANIFK